jgi:uncharacterized membrane protein YfcA
MTIAFALSLLAAFFAGVVGGGINSVAGGGSMVGFPVLLAVGLSPLSANMTNTVGIWPGSLGSIWGFRVEFARVPKVYRWLLVPSLAGAMLGAYLLRVTSPVLFAKIVPGLILFATAMFIVAPAVRAKLNARLEPGHQEQAARVGRAKLIAVVALQIAVSIYGGYFGAGMSILMLSILSVIGMTDMLEMNAMTSFLSLFINGVAGVYFLFSGLVSLRYAAPMAAGAILGGYYAAGLARRVGNVWIRRLVIAIGVTLATVMLVRLL